MFRWSKPLGRGALDRKSPACVAVGQDKLYSFGGIQVYTLEMEDREEERQIPAQMDVHIFNTLLLRWIKLPAVTTETGQRPPEVPSARMYHTAVLVDDIVYVWGGLVFKRKPGSRNELHGFNVDTHRWSRPEVYGTVPPWMRSHSACVVGKVMYVYGNWFEMSEYHDFVPYIDMYKLDTVTMLWSLITTGGPAQPVSVFHSATAIGTKMFVFGGRPSQHCRGSFQFYNIRVFDTETNSWLSKGSLAQPHPEGRQHHAAFAHHGELYIFAGEAIEPFRHFNDLWKFSPETFSWRKVEPKGKQPSARYGMGRCVVGDALVLFGGVDDGMPCDEMLILHLSRSLKSLCKLAVLQYGLECSELPHDIRWELATMTPTFGGVRH